MPGIAAAVPFHSVLRSQSKPHHTMKPSAYHLKLDQIDGLYWVAARSEIGPTYNVHIYSCLAEIEAADDWE